MRTIDGLGDWLGWTADTRFDAEECARRIAADMGVPRERLIVRPANDRGWEVFWR